MKFNSIHSFDVKIAQKKTSNQKVQIAAWADKTLRDKKYNRSEKEEVKATVEKLTSKKRYVQLNMNLLSSVKLEDHM